MSKAITLEENVPLSDSLIWKFQRTFFEDKGVNAWVGEVPYYVTCNITIAKAYAEMAGGFIYDGIKNNTIITTEPLYILELGSGTGKFGFHFMTYLLRYLNEHMISHIDIRYIITDFTESNLNFWKTHPQLTQYVEKGHIDFAIYDLIHSDTITLIHSKETLSKKSLANPLLVNCNYIFDTVEHDCFQFGPEGLKKGGITTSISSDSYDASTHKVKNLEKLHTQFTFTDTDTHHYKNPHLNTILKEYSTEFSSTSTNILIPIGGINAIDTLSSFSQKGALFIVGDKGYANVNHMRQLDTPHIAFHGSFSLMVNFDALSRYVTKIGGSALTGINGFGLKTALYYTKSLADFPLTRYAYKNYDTSLSTQTFLSIKNVILSATEKLKIEEIISLLRLSNWDCTLFYNLINTLIEKFEKPSLSVEHECQEGAQLLLKNFFFMPNDQNQLFEIGRFFYLIKDYKKALYCYEESNRLYKVDPSSLHFNKGLCHYYMNDSATALKQFKESYKQNTTLTIAKEWIDFIEKPEAPTTS